MTGLTKVDRLSELVRPAVEACQVELWGVEFFPQGRKSILRVYIDTDHGVTVDSCADVSRQISAVLDIEDPIAGEYVLEVSSPGWDRPIFTLDQCRKYVDSQISVRLLVPVAGRRRFKGQLTDVSAEGVLSVVVDGESVQLVFSQIDKINLVAA